jgi:nicotinate-nucleotide adenylyltransferase
MPFSPETAGRPVGILGGTFDPVHYGHLRAAVEVGESLELGEVRMLLSARPPHRPQPAASAEHRFDMLRLATGSQGFLVADDSELRRPGPSYMVDTLAGFRERLGDVPLVLIIGQDAANGLDRWHRWRRLFELAHVAVMHRPGAASDYRGELAECMRERRADGPRALHGERAGRVLPVEITQLEIASTTIRSLVAAGRSPSFLTPEPVADYIREHGLYAC